MTTKDSYPEHQVAAFAADQLAELFRHVDAREKPPAKETEAIRSAVHRDWQSATRQRRTRQLGAMAMAASLFLAIVFVGILNPPSSPEPGAVLAEAGRQSGKVQLMTADGKLALLSAQATHLRSGQTVQTSIESGLALQWNSGAILRLGEQSELLLVSDQQIQLLRGRLYIDTSPHGKSLQAPQVATREGRIHHVGTRYMTESTSSGTRVSVREGLVNFEPGPGQPQQVASVTSGTRLSVDSQGAMNEIPIDTWGEQWAWAENLAQQYPREDASLDELFQWVARETGQELVYASVEIRQQAIDTQIHGKLDLPPRQALEAAMATSDFEALAAEGQLRISLKR